jgi:bifunctional non-homologous end joining protein LigD
LRSRDWIKTPHRKRSEFVIGGWLPGVSVNRHTVAALLVGAYADGELIFCGCVGAGISEAAKRRLSAALKPLHCNASPFTSVPAVIARHALWVHAELVGDVEYREYVGGLRHPSWKGLRADTDCRLVGLPS